MNRIAPFLVILLVALAACSTYPGKAAIEIVASESVFSEVIPGGIEADVQVATSCSRVGSADEPNEFVEGGVTRVVALDTPLEPFRTDAAEFYARLAEADGWEIVGSLALPESSDADRSYSIMEARRAVEGVPMQLTLRAEIQRPQTRLFRFFLSAAPAPDTFCD